MTQPLLTSNPFALMMAPEAIFAAIEHSERLGRLKSRICRPLDGPRPPLPSAVDVCAFDASVDAANEPIEWPTIHGPVDAEVAPVTDTVVADPSCY